ncbi:hypothetical protein C0995_014991 [Termitomyces sp. Mi166|nr:hypothetical protein C0995_014991 [Termitomyces sp. Mi166\
MSAPLRTKRNFKALQIPVEEPTPPHVPTRASLLQVSAPPKRPLGPQPLPPKRRPPPLGDAAPVQGFLSPAVDSAVNSGRHSALIHATLAKMELEPTAPVEITDLKNADLKNLAELGQGNGGSVMKVEHVPSGTVMAKKIVLIDAQPAVRKQILRELQIMHSCTSPYIISTYGAFLSEPNICICMEFMDKGSFDSISKTLGAIDICVVQQLAYVVLQGLTYLYDVHRIIHRGVSKDCRIVRLHQTFEYTVQLEGRDQAMRFWCIRRAHQFHREYLRRDLDIHECQSLLAPYILFPHANKVNPQPERIQGAEYSVKSDVWSLGISLIELATSRFPFSESGASDDEDENDSDLDAPDNPNTLTLGRTARRRSRQTNSSGGGGRTMSIIELMHQIVREPAPRLGPKFAPEEEEFVDACLLKDPEERKAPKDLLAGDMDADD